MALLSVYVCSSWFYKIGSDKPPHSWMGSSPWGSLLSHQCAGTLCCYFYLQCQLLMYIHPYKKAQVCFFVFFFFEPLCLDKKKVNISQIYSGYFNFGTPVLLSELTLPLHFFFLVTNLFCLSFPAPFVSQVCWTACWTKMKFGNLSNKKWKPWINVLF